MVTLKLHATDEHNCPDMQNNSASMPQICKTILLALAVHLPPTHHTADPIYALQSRADRANLAKTVQTRTETKQQS
ncbi:hypothetical protein HYC85_001681 [Camellia sinensis]|uniref:Uncharacterized protein n=1 Tax=Camellia sinensis TaxID=4442 RepID=A0A7J7I618_CAMSI|nr:hypothetical protein HYC85_001681 [Camellia sinensis]